MELFRMPRVALNDDVMVLSSWIVDEGANVSEGAPIVEVETAKATMEVEASSSGVLAMQVRPAGSEVSPGDVIGVIAEEGEIFDPAQLRLHNAPTDTETPSTDADASEEPIAEADGDHPPAGEASAALVATAVRASTAVAAVVGADALSEMHHRVPRATSGFLVGSLSKRPAPLASSRATIPTKSFALSRHRLALGRLMTASAAIPQFSVHADIPAHEVTTVIERLRSVGIAATFTDVLLRAIAVVLRQHPQFNSQFTGTELIEFDRVSIGLAVDTESGVLAPVIHNVDGMRWRELAETRKDLVERARAGRLPPSNLSGGTFSISNVGPFGVHALVPMITPPQTAILGIAATRPTSIGDAFTAALVADHRVHDGADAARFLASFTEALGHADRLLLS